MSTSDQNMSRSFISVEMTWSAWFAWIIYELPNSQVSNSFQDKHFLQEQTIQESKEAHKIYLYVYIFGS